MSVIDETFALFSLMTEFSIVRVSGSSWEGLKVLKFFGSNLDSSISSPLRISLTSLAGSSCTESTIVSTVKEFCGIALGSCGRVAPLLTGAPIIPTEDVSASFPEGSLFGIVEAGAAGEEQLKARTAA